MNTNNIVNKYVAVLFIDSFDYLHGYRADYRKRMSMSTMREFNISYSILHHQSRALKLWVRNEGEY